MATVYWLTKNPGRKRPEIYIICTPSHEIGIEVIDNQHRRVVEYINEVYAVREKQEPRARLAEVLFDLVDYTMSHFAFEEALMDEAGYPDIALHRLTHDTFTRQIQTFKKRFEDGEESPKALPICCKGGCLSIL